MGVYTDPPPSRRLAGMVFNLNSSEYSSAFWIYTLITILYGAIFYGAIFYVQCSIPEPSRELGSESPPPTS